MDKVKGARVAGQAAELLLGGTLSAAEIAEGLGLELDAAIGVCRELSERSILQAADGKGNEGSFRLSPNAGLVAAVDFSAENTLVCVADLSGRILGRRSLGRAFIVTSGVLLEAADTVDELIAESGSSAELLTVCISAPGRIDSRTGKFESSHRFESAASLDLRAFFADRLDCEVIVRNDVMLSLEGELMYGKLSSAAKSALMLYFDAGIGAAMLIGGKPYAGDRGFAGKLDGYISDITEEDEPHNLAYSLSLPGMAKALDRELSKDPASQLALLRGERETDFALLARGYEEGDGVCLHIVGKAAVTIANLICNLAGFLDTGTVLLNGGITALGDKFLEQVRSAAVRRIPELSVQFSGLKERAAIVGALYAARETATEGLLFRMLTDS